MRVFRVVRVASVVCGLCCSATVTAQEGFPIPQTSDSDFAPPAAVEETSPVPASPSFAPTPELPPTVHPLSDLTLFAAPMIEAPSVPMEMAIEECPQFENQLIVPTTVLQQSIAMAMVQLPAIFVHERRTVRTSERTAEIWVQLPKNSESYVSVNFVEHPPEGDFRIFRTRLNTQQPRRYYLSARRWDRVCNQWIDLIAGTSLSINETLNVGYVDLGPGQRAVVAFTDRYPADSLAAVSSLHAKTPQAIEPLMDTSETVESADGTHRAAEHQGTIASSTTPVPQVR